MVINTKLNFYILNDNYIRIAHPGPIYEVSPKSATNTNQVRKIPEGELCSLLFQSDIAFRFCYFPQNTQNCSVAVYGI